MWHATVQYVPHGAFMHDPHALDPFDLDPVAFTEADRARRFEEENDKLERAVALSKRRHRNREFFHWTPRMNIRTDDQQKAMDIEAAAFENDLGTAIYAGISVNQLTDPWSRRENEARAEAEKERKAAEKKARRKAAAKQKRNNAKSNI